MQTLNAYCPAEWKTVFTWTCVLRHTMSRTECSGKLKTSPPTEWRALLMTLYAARVCMCVCLHRVQSICESHLIYCEWASLCARVLVGGLLSCGVGPWTFEFTRSRISMRRPHVRTGLKITAVCFKWKSRVLSICKNTNCLSVCVCSLGACVPVNKMLS